MVSIAIVHECRAGAAQFLALCQGQQPTVTKPYSASVMYGSSHITSANRWEFAGSSGLEWTAIVRQLTALDCDP